MTLTSFCKKFHINQALVSEQTMLMVVYKHRSTDQRITVFGIYGDFTGTNIDDDNTGELVFCHYHQHVPVVSVDEIEYARIVSPEEAIDRLNWISDAMDWEPQFPEPA